MNKNRLLIKEVGSWKAHGLGIAVLMLLGCPTAPSTLAHTLRTPAARAQKSTITTLATFNGANGIYPGELTLSGSTLYGISGKGGAHGYGVVFSVPTTGGTPTVLASFDGHNGAGPQGGLTLIGSTLFGTTSGTIYPKQPPIPRRRTHTPRNYQRSLPLLLSPSFLRLSFAINPTVFA